MCKMSNNIEKYLLHFIDTLYNYIIFCLTKSPKSKEIQFKMISWHQNTIHDEDDPHSVRAHDKGK